jgi:hypothetical protein
MSSTCRAEETRSQRSGSRRQDHPAERTLRRFALGATSRAENLVIVAHLLRRCGLCARVACAALDDLADRAGT